jgi:hypothetical protein
MNKYICPNCKNPIYDPDALLCHFCGGSLQRAGKGFISRIRYSNERVLWFFLIFAVLLAFILLFVR